MQRTTSSDLKMPDEQLVIICIPFLNLLHGWFSSYHCTKPRMFYEGKESLLLLLRMLHQDWCQESKKMTDVYVLNFIAKCN